MPPCGLIVTSSTRKQSPDDSVQVTLEESIACGAIQKMGCADPNGSNCAPGSLIRHTFAYTGLVSSQNFVDKTRARSTMMAAVRRLWSDFCRWQDPRFLRCILLCESRAKTCP